MKSKNHLSFVFFSLFLLLLSLSLLSYQLFKVPKEVEAVVGILDLYAQTTSSLNTPGGIWNSLGNVGIGTTAPRAKLDLGSSGGSVFVLNPGSATGPTYTGFVHNDLIFGSYISGGYPQGFISTGHTADVNRKFHIGNANSSTFDGSTTFVPAFTVTSGGKVGIGTTAPTEKLTINSGNIQINGTANGIIFKEPGYTYYSTIYGWGELNLINFNGRGILFATGPTPGQGITRMVISKNGNVGIGNSTDSYKLDVTGDVVARGQVYSSTYGWLSDERLKKNIQPIANPIETLIQINGKSFDWRKDEFSNRILPDGLQYGMIAQDVEKILPSVVTTMKDGFKTINYSSFTPFIIEAIKEQQIQIESLTKKTDNQQKQIDDLKKTIEELKK